MTRSIHGRLDRRIILRGNYKISSCGTRKEKKNEREREAKAGPDMRVVRFLITGTSFCENQNPAILSNFFIYYTAGILDFKLNFDLLQD